MRLGLIFLACALAVGAYFGLQTSLNHIVEHGIETLGPELTGTTVEIGEVDLSLFSGKGAIRGIVIGNPKGFETDRAFKLDEVRVDLVPLSVFGHSIVIEEIFIDGPEITYEKKDESSNLLQIAKNVQTFAGGQTSEEESSEEAEAKDSSDTKIRIDRFELREASVRAGTIKDKTLELTLPTIELTDLGAPDGAAPAEVSAEVAKTVTGRVTAAVTKKFLALGAGDGDGKRRRRERKQDKAEN